MWWTDYSTQRIFQTCLRVGYFNHLWYLLLKNNIITHFNRLLIPYRNWRQKFHVPRTAVNPKIYFCLAEFQSYRPLRLLLSHVNKIQLQRRSNNFHGMTVETKRILGLKPVQIRVQIIMTSA